MQSYRVTASCDPQSQPNGEAIVDFEHILDQAVSMLQRRDRIAYSVLKRQFELDDACLDDLKDAILMPIL